MRKWIRLICDGSVDALLPVDQQRAVHRAQHHDHRCDLREHQASMP